MDKSYGTITDENIDELDRMQRKWFGISEHHENRMTSSTEINSMVEGLCDNQNLNRALFPRKL